MEMTPRFYALVAKQRRLSNRAFREKDDTKRRKLFAEAVEVGRQACELGGRIYDAGKYRTDWKGTNA